MRYAARLEFQCTNNIAEYNAVLLGLRKARAMGIQSLIIKTDSQVVAGHIEKDYKARDLELAKYLQFLREQEKYFEGFTVKNISRTDNSDTDEIAKAASQNQSEDKKQPDWIIYCDGAWGFAGAGAAAIITSPSGSK